MTAETNCIVVTGGGGMVGRALRDELPEARFLTRSDCDLENLADTRRSFDGVRPKVLVHLAGLVGGIQDNVNRPYDYVVGNLLINTNTLQAALDSGVEYFVGLSSTCAYPGVTPEYPMREGHIHLGPPAAENLPYGYAKRLLGVALDAACKQYGLTAAVLYPCNLYGPHDSFDLQKSHLVAALIRKAHEARIAGRNELALLGTGRPLRQFMFVSDLAKAIAHFARLRVSGHFNVATPENLPVDSIARIVQDVVGCPAARVYSGSLDGQLRKDASSDELLRVIPGFRFTPLADGVRKTYEWYLQNMVPAN